MSHNLPFLALFSWTMVICNKAEGQSHWFKEQKIWQLKNGAQDSKKLPFMGSLAPVQKMLLQLQWGHYGGPDKVTVVTWKKGDNYGGGMHRQCPPLQEYKKFTQHFLQIF